MATFTELERAAPPIADFLRARIAAAGLCFLATTRRDGWPRVSPLELSIIDGRIYVGSMPAAVKAKDLQRDPRACLITALADKDDLGGEAKAFCRAREVVEVDEWERVRHAGKELTDFDIGELGGAHLFELDIQAAAWQRVEGDDWRTTSWTPDGGMRERIRGGPTGETRDL